MRKKITMLMFVLVCGVVLFPFVLSAQTFPQTKYICATYNNQTMRMGILTININSAGNYECKFYASLGLNDNTYGTSTHSSWGSKVHKLGDLIGSDKAIFEVRNAANAKVLAFEMDYFSAKSTFPTGYGTFGPFGGDGKITFGNGAWVLDYNSSLARNFNEFNYILTTNSANPGRTTEYKTDPNYPNWIWQMVYEVTIDKAVFGSSGYGNIMVTGMHNSPSKISAPKTGFFECDPLPGSIGDRVWNDDNKNGIQDPGELGVEGVTVKLFDCNDNLISTTTTNALGIYSFTNLIPGEYYVQFVLPAGYEFSPANMGNNALLDSDANVSTGKTTCFTISEGQNDLSWDAGIYEAIYTCDIGDRVWKDLNHNGIQDQNEPGVSGIAVQLFNCNNVLISSTVTDNNGYYLFNDVPSGNYYIKVFAPEGWDYTIKDAGSDDLLDSDVNPETGKTDCFTIDGLNCGDNSVKWDAGIYPSPSPTGSIGDRLWNDLNGNGIQDIGEPGYQGMWVGLFDCSGNLLSSKITDMNGNYLFTNLSAGNYYVEFALPNGYVFSPKNQGSNNALDSDVNSNGKTDCFTLASGENNLTIDAGVTIACNPIFYVTKDDYKLYMPPVNSTNTYNITFGNTGNVPINNVIITDTLPQGTSYLSCTGGTWCGVVNNGVVQFNIGTLNPGQTGLVKVTVLVNQFHEEYLNKVIITGKDPSNNYLFAQDTDLNIADTCSGGGGSGIESRGEMAELLLKRQLLIRYGMTTKLLSNNMRIFSSLELSDLIPSAGPHNSVAVETTPFDILGISNAVSAYAADYIANFNGEEKRVAGIFSTITLSPSIYDHTKAVCDRLGGAEITNITREVFDGRQFYAARLAKKNENTADFAISFSVYELANGYVVDNRWTFGEYNVPTNALNVYNFQVWSGTMDDTKSLVKDIINIFKTLGNVSYAVDTQVNAEIFISKAKYSHDGRINLDFINNGTAKQISLNIKFRYSQGEEPYITNKTYTISEGTSTLSIPFGILADANIIMTQPQGFIDEVFVSGGAYAYVNGPTSSVLSFNTSDFDPQNISDYPEGSLVLAGGASLNGTLNDWVSIVRALTTNGSAYDLSNTNAIRFVAKGTGVVDVILDQTNTQNYNYHAYTITLTPDEKEYIINFNDFHERWGTQTPVDPSLIRLAGFILDKAKNPNVDDFELKVYELAFIPNGATEIKNEGSVLNEYSLSQNYPNPFNPSTVIEFNIPAADQVTLKVYDILGREVATLINGEINPGLHRVHFNGSQLASGMYIYRLTGKSVNITKKMLLTK
jgi:uncharacterized repeat protein (TIGR01451 family)